MERGDDRVEPETAAQVEMWIPLARPITIETIPPPLNPPAHEILLLSQSRKTVIADIVLFVALFLLFALGGEFAIGLIYRAAIAHRFTGDDALNTAVARNAIFPVMAWRAVSATLVTVWLVRRRGLHIRSVGLTKRRLWLNILLGAATFILIILAVSILGRLAEYYFPQLTREFEKNADMIMDAVPKVSPPAFLAMALLIGYYEELIFRGFLMTRIRRATGSWILAVLGNSAIFIPLHLMDQAPAAMFAVGSLSLLFSIVTAWRRSLIPAIIAHALFDLTMFLNLYYAAGDQWK
jgi:membrane protease YdiL (CAAX protease family)